MRYYIGGLGLLLAVTLISGTAFAHNIAGGCSSNSNKTLSNENSFATLCSTTLSLTDDTHFCVATGSADVQNPHSGTDNDYLFVLSTTSTGPGFDSAWERKVELNDNPGVDDPDSEIASTVRFFQLSPGTYTFYWLGRPEGPGDANVTVADYSMGVVCTDGR